MPDRFLPDYGLYLLGKGVWPETRSTCGAR